LFDRVNDPGPREHLEAVGIETLADVAGVGEGLSEHPF
jgi:hypothetical protein